MISTLPKVRSLVLVTAISAVVLFVYSLCETTQFARERVISGYLKKEFSKNDSITRAIRDKSRTFYQVHVENAEDKKRVRRLGQVVADQGDSVLISAREKVALPEDAEKLETTISLPGKEFDPISQPPYSTVPSGLERASQGDGYYIVQFGMTATDELLDSLKATGVEILQYVPHQAFFVYGSGEAIARAATHSRVRWVGSFLPEYKISAAVDEQLNSARKSQVPARGITPLELTGRSRSVFDVSVFDRADLKDVASRISALGGNVRDEIELPENFFDIIRVEIDIASAESIAAIPDVIRIDSWSRPVAEDERAAQIVAGNYSSTTAISPPGYDPLTQFGVNGQNVTVAVVDDGVGIPGDGGFYVTASNAVNGPLRGATSGAQGHGHLQASIIAGDAPFSVLDPTGYNYGLGIAPKSNIVNIPFLRAGYTGTEATTANDAVITAGPNAVPGFISNNSWGNGTNGNVYDSYAAQFDGFVRDASTAASIDPLLMVFSAGNSGASGLTRPKVAKNLIAVASLENLRTELDSSANNIDDLSSFSSLGPASGGRIKPDIAAPGQAITGGRSGTDALFGNIDAAHRWSSGTSHASPQVAGAAALFTQFWKNGHAGANPSPALVKAALINGARDANGVGTAAAVPNGSEGWGRVYLKGMLNTGAAISYVNESSTLFGTGAFRDFSGTVADISRPVRVSLVWTDPPAVSDPALVNNLDLEVTVGGNTYKGNVLSGGLSATGGSADSINNVENVFLPAGLTGLITVRVKATAINGNGVLGNGDATDQHFALVVFNANVSLASSPNLSMNSPVVITGNSVIEPNECNSVNISLVNSGDVQATTVSAALTSTTPGVTIMPLINPYPNIGANGDTQISLAPFQISTAASVACLTNIDLTLTVIYSGVGSPQAFNFTLPVGTFADPMYGFSSSGGGSISATGSVVSGSAVDDALLNFTAPFNFSIYGTSVSAGSTMQLSTNGFVVAGTGASSSGSDNEALPSSNSATFPASVPILFPYWDDLDMRPSVTSSGGIFTEVTGSIGSRVLKVEWRARHFVTGQTVGSRDTNFAVYLHENSSQFEFVYAQTGAGANASGASATVGVQSATSGTLFTQFSSNTSSLSTGLQLSATQTPAACSAGAGPCFATAANVSVSGRALNSIGRGIGNAIVTISSPDGSHRSARTSSFGYFRFDDVEAGRSYVIEVSSKRYRFAPRVLEISENIDGLDFVAEN